MTIKRSEKIAFIAACIGAAASIGLNVWLGTAVWSWWVHAIIWAFVAAPTYTVLLTFAALQGSVDK